jgi:glycosyltransferase involved in cell wall biosynthesis
VRPDVLFALLGDVTGSSRALRQIRALVEAGVRVDVAMVGSPRWPEALPESVAVSALPAPAGRGPAFFWRAHRALAAHALDRPAGVFHASDLHVLPAMAAAARKHTARLVYDAREWYRGIDAGAGRPWVGAAWGLVERRFAPRADLVMTVNDSIGRLLSERAGARRVHVMHNVTPATPAGRTGELRKRLGMSDDQPLVLYQGLFREGRGLIELMDAVAGLENVAIALIGEGPLEEAVRSRAAGLDDRAFVVPFIPPDELARLTPDADVGAVPLLPLTESLALALPNKVFEYAAAGLPILAGAGIEPMRALVVRYEAGVCVDPSDSDALREGLQRLLDPASATRFRTGAARLSNDYSWENERARFLEAYRDVL